MTARRRGVLGIRARRIAKRLLGRWVASRRQRPSALRKLVEQYEVGPLHLNEGRVPVRWFTKADNFGDLLAPWLVSKMTGREVTFFDRERPHYVVIGSILNRTNARSTVWGAGSFGTEDGRRFSSAATYTAVRGPLSRERLIVQDIPCPAVYGDPALLAPAYFAPRVRKTYRYGIVSRWSETRWAESEIGSGVRLIHLGTTDVEGVIEAMLSCRRIVTGSLHGLIMADAYEIPSAWVVTHTAYGGHYKFYDYFATVQKFRDPQHFDVSSPVTASRLGASLSFDGRPIRFDYRSLLDACPFLRPIPTSEGSGSADTEAMTLGHRVENVQASVSVTDGARLS